MPHDLRRPVRPPAFGPYTPGVVHAPAAPPAPAAPERLLELDWLRAFAMLWVVLFHCVLVFAGTGWLVNDGPARPRLALALEFTGQWRMPMLFFVAGAAVKMALRRHGTQRFLRERVKRLLVPLLAGLVLLVPVQNYLDVNGDHAAREGFLPFLAHFWTASVHEGRIVWQHLWFLAFLCVFTAGIIPLLLAAQRPTGRRVLAGVRRRLEGPGRILLVGCAFAVPYSLPDDLGRSGPLNVVGDAKLLAVFAAPFLLGWIFAGAPTLWQRLALERRSALRIALLATPTFVLARSMYWPAHARGDAPAAFRFDVAADTLEAMATWCCLVAALGYAIRYLRRQHPAIRYMRGASYPVYLLHQPVLVVLATAVVGWPVPAPAKFVAITAGTFACTALLYETVVRRTRAGRLLFGLAEPQRAAGGAEVRTPVRERSAA